MKRYEQYKDSGIAWLPKVPAHWEIAHLRKYLSLVSIKGMGDKQLLSVTREKGIIERNVDDQEENHNFVPDDLSGYKYVQPGQFVINKMKSWQGSYGVSDYEGIVSPAYYVCELDFPFKPFFSMAIRSRSYVDFFAQWSKGIRVGQWDLEPIALKSIPFFLDTNQEIFCNNNFDNLETTSEILSNITRSVRENFIDVVREKMETELEIKATSLQINSLRDKLILDNLSKNKKYIDTEEIIYEETKENNKTLMTNQSKRNSFASTHKIGIKNKSKIKKILSLEEIMKDNIKANSLFYIKNNELLNDAKNQINNYLNMNINVNINVNNNKFNKNPYSTSSFENEDKFKNSIDEQSFCEIELNDNNKIIDTPIQTEENSKDE